MYTWIDLAVSSTSLKMQIGFQVVNIVYQVIYKRSRSTLLLTDFSILVFSIRYIINARLLKDELFASI